MNNVHFVTDNPLLFYMMMGNFGPAAFVISVMVGTGILVWIATLFPYSVQQSKWFVRLLIFSIIVMIAVAFYMAGNC